MVQPERDIATQAPLSSADRMPEQLTFVIHPTDEFSTVDILVKSLEDTQRLLRHADQAIYRGATPRQRQWIVRSIRSSAPTITVAPSPEHQQAVEIVGDGLRIVTEGTDQPPQHFTEPVLEDLKRMRRLFRGAGSAESLDVLVDDQPRAIIGTDIEKQADRVLTAPCGGGCLAKTGGPYMSTLKDKCAIVGVGETVYNRDSGRTELNMAVEAANRAIADAGLVPQDIDGIVKFTADSTPQGELAACLGIPYLRYYGELGPLGGAACGLVIQSAMAVAQGLVNNVLVYRSVNGRSGQRYGSGTVTTRRGLGSSAFTEPYGLLVPGQSSALRARRHMHEFGTKMEHFGAVAVAFRNHACLNPKAIMHGRPITMEDYLTSRMFFDPLHILDCALEADGANAFVITSAERAANLKQPPVYITSAAQTLLAGMGGHGRSWEESGGALLAPELFGEAGVTPQDIDVVGFYDHFSPVIITKLEDYGFCPRGEGGPFVEGGRIEVGGELPVNTSGGHLSEAYLQGMNQIIEVARQLRGQSPAQVEGAELGLVDSGDGSGALILRR